MGRKIFIIFLSLEEEERALPANFQQYVFVPSPSNKFSLSLHPLLLLLLLLFILHIHLFPPSHPLLRNDLNG
jgi:hypothetical protein